MWGGRNLGDGTRRGAAVVLEKRDLGVCDQVAVLDGVSERFHRLMEHDGVLVLVPMRLCGGWQHTF